jgi:thioredoxin-related protein
MKAQLKFFLSVFVVLSLGVVFCSSAEEKKRIKGNGKIITRERTVTDFNGVVLEYVANIKIHFSDTYKVVVRMDSNLQDLLSVNVRNGLLYINAEKEIRPKKRTVIDVYLPEIKTVRLHGVGEIVLDSGSGSKMEAVLFGVGKINAQNYHVKEINIDHSGVGTMRIWADVINGMASGVGNVLYKGTPTVNAGRAGIGKIKKL